VELYTPLAKEHASSQQILDHAPQNIWAAKSTLATAKAQLKTVRGAAVEKAKTQSRLYLLTSPSHGLTGTSPVQVGALVSTSSVPVTTVSTLDPYQDYFTVRARLPVNCQKQFSGPRQTSMETAALLADGTNSSSRGLLFSQAGRTEQYGCDPTGALFPNPGNVSFPLERVGKSAPSLGIEERRFAGPPSRSPKLQGSYQVLRCRDDAKLAFAQKLGTASAAHDYPNGTKGR